MSKVEVTKKGQLFAALETFAAWLEASGYREAADGIMGASVRADGELTTEFCKWFNDFYANEGEGGVEQIVENTEDAFDGWKIIQNHLVTCRELYDRAIAEEISI